jgi:hypothetical protein
MTLSALGIFSAAGAGGVVAGSDYDLITTTILGSTTYSVTFDTSALSAYKHLQIRYTARSTDDSQTLFATFNGVTGTSYAAHRLFGNGSSMTSDAFTSRANLFVGTNGTSNNAANSFGAGVIDILDFSSTTKNTTTRVLAGNSGTTATVQLQSGLFNNTAAITSMTIFGNTGNLVAGTRFSLYGIKG